MSIKLIPIILFLFTFYQVSGQDFEIDNRTLHNIDSVLHNLADSNLKPMKRINGNLKLVSYYTYSHPSVDSLIEDALSIAREKEIPFFIARSLMFRTRNNLYQNEVDSIILRDLQEIEIISDTLNNKLIPGWISRLYAEFRLRNGDLDAAKIHLDSLTRRLEDNRFATKGPLNTFWGMYYQRTKEYSKAMEYYSLALNSVNPGGSFIYNNIASLQLEMDNLTEANKYVEKAIAFARRVNNGISLIQGYNLKGQISLAQNDTISALNYFRKSEALRLKPYLSKNYTAAHLIVQFSKDEKETTAILDDLSSYEKTEEYPFLLALKGERYLKENKLELAFQSCEKSQKNAIRINAYDAGIKACDCLINICQQKKDNPCVIKYLIAKSELKDLSTSQKRITFLARNLANYEANKEKALLEQAHKKDKEIISERLNKILIGTILSFILLCLAGYTVFQLKRRNKKIDQQNLIIEKALSEKDLLLREIHHRVKNNLQLVSSLLTLQSYSIDDEAALKAITEGKSRVRSMALIHQDLYNRENLTGIRVKTYLEKLTQELFSTYKIGTDKINLKLEIEDFDIDVNTLVPLGLIINELITNSLKYAFPNNRSGSLWISLKEENDKLVLKIKDDGIGYDESQIRTNSFGSTLIGALTEQLSGELTKDAISGTSITIKFEDYKSI